MRRPVLAGGIVKLPSGRGWIVCGEALEAEEGPETGFGKVRVGQVVQKAFALFTADGLTFSDPVLVARDPTNRTYYWDQRGAAATAEPAGSGLDLVHAFWTHDADTATDMDIHLSFGSSDSRTWQKPHSTGLVGQIAQPISLADGRRSS
jgi:hypothetical protein